MNFPQLSGAVIRGKQLGRQLGYKTANLDTIIPPSLDAGVYAGYAWLDDGHATKFKAAIIVGVPTPAENEDQPTPPPHIEVHILDFNQDIYGATLHIEPLHFLRPLEQYHSTDALKLQIQIDLSQTQFMLT